MSNALAWIRKSKGSDDDIGLQQQRQEVTALAEDLADTVEKLDLGVQTGFSSMTRDGDGLLDQRDDVKEAVEACRQGKYDYLVAYDDRRVCRDEYMKVIEYACKQGGLELAFVADVETDDLAYDIHRRVERQTKEEEIEKARAAVEERKNRGFWQGEPPLGLQFDENGERLVPDDEFDTVIEVFDQLESDKPYAAISNEVGVATGTITKLKNRGREFYEKRRAQ